jgi:hypothetical protein
VVYDEGRVSNSPIRIDERPMSMLPPDVQYTYPHHVAVKDVNPALVEEPYIVIVLKECQVGQGQTFCKKVAQTKCLS